MKASIGGTVVAEAPEADLVTIEDNYYFPPASITAAAFADSATQYNCPWKGDALHHDVTAAGSSHHDAAWSYPTPYPASFETVGSDYSGYVAFDASQVTIS